MKKTNSIVGYTGFVGSNIAANGEFDGVYNTKNIESAFGSRPDTLVYAGLRAEKYIANKFPNRDLQAVYNAMDNIKKINPSRLVLISTIDVYDRPMKVDEDCKPDEAALLPYGKNRLLLEAWVEENFEDYCIVRLPALFGRNMKKNFIYDMINIIPFKLNEQNFRELAAKDGRIKDYYRLDSEGFYKCCDLGAEERKELRGVFGELGFSAVNFTDSRSVYQFYNLQYLWGHISKCLELKIKKINMATEPVRVDALYQYITGGEFENNISQHPFAYDFRTKYHDAFGGRDGYIFGKEQVMKEIKCFVEKRMVEG